VGSVIVYIVNGKVGQQYREVAATLKLRWLFLMLKYY